jgi:hypothetical protein
MAMAEGRQAGGEKSRCAKQGEARRMGLRAPDVS